MPKHVSVVIVLIILCLNCTICNESVPTEQLVAMYEDKEPLRKQNFNFASFDVGAKIMSYNPEGKVISKYLNEMIKTFSACVVHTLRR